MSLRPVPSLEEQKHAPALASEALTRIAGEVVAELERVAVQIPRELAPRLLGDLERIKAVIWVRMTAPPSGADDRAGERHPPLFTYATAALHLGVPVSRVKQAVREQSLRAVKIGHYTRFRRADLDEFVERMKDYPST